MTATERLLDAAGAAGVERIVHVSTINAFGDTGYRVVDETYERPQPYRYVSFYDETKHRAHLAAHARIVAGSPVLIAMPGGVYGPGDHSSIGGVMRRRRRGGSGADLRRPGPEHGARRGHRGRDRPRRRAGAHGRVVRPGRRAEDHRRARAASGGDRRAPAAAHRHADVDAACGRAARPDVGPDSGSSSAPAPASPTGRATRRRAGSSATRRATWSRDWSRRSAGRRSRCATGRPGRSRRLNPAAARRRSMRRRSWT